jgi:hypothetical protein
MTPAEKLEAWKFFAGHALAGATSIPDCTVENAVELAAQSAESMVDAMEVAEGIFNDGDTT